MFPTPVGMNRINNIVNQELRYVPHTRGDEPGFFVVTERGI